MVENKFAFKGLLIASFLALFVLVVPMSVTALAIIPILILAIAMIMVDEHKNRINKQIISRPFMVLLVSITTIVLIYRFYRQFFTPLGDIKDLFIVSILNISNRTQVLAITSVLAVLVIPFISLAFHWIASMIVDKSNNEERTEVALSFGKVLLIFAIAAITMTLFSKSSPLYPLNDWVDANIFLTVGKSVLHGKVLYQDIYEQKGPLLFFLMVIPALISETSFIGLYFIEILCCFVFLLYSYKIMLLINKNVPIIILPVYSFAIYCTASFRHGGSVEELCLPMLTISLYILTRAVLVKKSHMTILEAFINGIFIGCVFWIKYTMLGLYVGYALYVLISYCSEREFGSLLKIVGSVLAGIAVVSIPVLLYFILNNALPDLFEAYFYNNLFLYTAKSAGLLQNILNGVTKTVSKNLIVMGMIGIGFFSLLINHQRLAVATIICFVISMMLIITRHVYLYYPFILCVYAPFGFSAICQMLSNKIDLEKVEEHKYKLPTLIVVAALCFMLFLRSSNSYLFLANKETMPQYVFSDIIAQDEDRSLFCYGTLDLGIYTTTGTIPDTKYFCKFNVDLPEMNSEQERYIDEAVVRYVVTMDEELVSPKYKLIKTVDYYFEGKTRVYNLYHRIDQ